MAFKELFSLGDFYLSDFLNPGEPQPAKFKLGLSLDTNSGLVRLTNSVPREKMFGRYFYSSGTNSTMKSQLADVVKNVLDCIELQKDDIWIDVAANDGTLLSFVPQHIYRVGIDPAEDCYKKQAEQHANLIIQDYFPTSQLKLDKPAKAFSVIAMFYDLEKPDEFLRAVYNNLDDDGLLVLQMSYSPLMVTQLAFDNIVHEHFYYYSLFNLKKLLETNGFKVVDCSLNDTNGGSFRVLVMKDIGDITKFSNAPNRDVCNYRIESILAQENKLRLDEEDTWMVFFNRISKLKTQVMDFIVERKNRGKTIYGLGASTKASTMYQFFGLDNKIITAIAERNPRKFGLVTSGTRIPIVSEEEFRNSQPDYCILNIWHFVEECVKREQEYINKGGIMIVPMPRFELISK